MISYLRRQQKLKRQLEEISSDTWDGRLYANDWDEWPLMQQAMQALERKMDKELMESLKNKQAEYLALQNQINPHFLYNTLEAIRGDALCEGVQGIADTTKALATFFRYTITEVGYEVTLEDELHNVENYFTIQQYRFGDRLQMNTVIRDEDINLLQSRIPKLTLQPLVENAILHGLENKIGSGTVSLMIEASERNLYITVKDNGIGIEEEQLRRLNTRINRTEDREHFEKGSIALLNVNSRIRLLYGTQYGLHIYSVLGMGTKVRLTLPILLKSPECEER